MGFEKRDTAKKYTAKDGDSLRSLAEQETAAGNEMTWQELAKFNWGTDDPREVNAFMRDELGCRKRDADNNFVFSTDDEPKGDPLLIPKAFKRPGLPIDKTHVLSVKKKVAPKQFLDCACIPGVTFEFDKSFIRPSVVDHLKKLDEALVKHPGAKLMIFGHTDKVGSEQYNKLLSERRAKSVFAFITNDAAVWEGFYNEENWGTRVIQEMLVDFGFDPGPVDGINGPKTQAAVKEYQAARGLAVDGVAGPATRKVMFTEYMSTKHDVAVTADQFMDPKHMGCSEFNPVEETEAANESNRRVTIFLFNPARLPKLPCKLTDIAPCKKQVSPPTPRFKPSFKCSFFDSIARDCHCEGGGGGPPPPPVTRDASLRLVTVDALFAPGTENLDIRYEVQDPHTVITSAKLEILTGSGAGQTVLHTINGIPHTNGTHNLTWDGKKSDNNFISFNQSPYTVRIVGTASVQVTGSLRDEKETKVELHSLETFVRGAQIQVVGGNTRVQFERNQRATPNAITQAAEFIVEATLRFKSKSGNPVTTPIPVRLDWSYEDPACDTAGITNAAARAYVNLALTFNTGKSASTPPGDNCHKDIGGKRGDTAHRFFKQHTGFNIAADGAPNFHAKAQANTETSGTFTVQTIVDGQTLQTVADRHAIPVEDLNSANAALVGQTFASGTSVTIPKRGKSIIEFATSSIAGDNYKVIVLVHDQAAMKKETPVITVFRRVPVEVVQEMDGGGEHCTSGSTTLQPVYNPANTIFALPAVTNIALQNPLWPHVRATPPSFPRILREAFPPAPANDTVYENRIRTDSFNAEAQFELDMHAGTGIQLIGAHILRLTGRPRYVNDTNAAGAVIRRRNVGGENGQTEGGGFNTGTNRIIIYHTITFTTVTALVTHEMGHLLNLEHQTNTGGGAAFPADHDPADPAPAAGAGGCLMRGDANSDHFCGKCLLKLWGWNITTLTGPGLV